MWVPPKTQLKGLITIHFQLQSLNRSTNSQRANTWRMRLTKVCASMKARSWSRRATTWMSGCRGRRRPSTWTRSSAWSRCSRRCARAFSSTMCMPSARAVWGTPRASRRRWALWRAWEIAAWRWSSASRRICGTRRPLRSPTWRNMWDGFLLLTWDRIFRIGAFEFAGWFSRM